MSTPHNSAQPGQIAKTVLMPGDPLRAKFIAEKFLSDAVLFNSVRGMLGYTGTYEGKSVSVMGSGMGMPSMGIYSWELFTHYEVDAIIRIGSAGAYSPELSLFDMVLADAAWSESSYAHTQNGCEKDIISSSCELNENIRQSAARLGKKLTEGTIHSSDVFYRQERSDTPHWQIFSEQKGCLAVEMESFALFHNAHVNDKKAACLLTISDSLCHSQSTSSHEREQSFTDMMQVALGAV